jgi:hypothetical protein
MIDESLSIDQPRLAAHLVVLAAANRDPAANRPRPRHATAGVAGLRRRGAAPVALASGVAYRPSANVRWPLF